MLDPDHVHKGVSPLQSRVLMNAEATPQAGSNLNGYSVGFAQADMDALTSAGFLQRHQRGKRVLYFITPAGAEFRAYLLRLEAARD